MSRADRLAAALEVDALLITNLVNLRYVTGFTGSNGIAVVGRDLRRFVTDFRYIEQAAEQVDGFDRELAPQVFDDALRDGWPDGPLRLGFEDQHVSVRRHGRLRELLPERIELVPAGGAVEELRAIKDAAEVERIRAAAALVDEIYGTLREQGLVGRTEREVALTIELELRRIGAEGLSFDLDRRLGRARCAPARGADRRADPARHARHARHRRAARRLLLGLHEDVGDRRAAGRPRRGVRARAARPGASRSPPCARGLRAARSTRCARRIIEEAGHGEHFGHGLGHGVGMEIHEAPRLARTAEGTLVAGHVVTVEPGVYLPGRGGVRIEDLVVVTEDGHSVISTTTKDLINVD